MSVDNRGEIVIAAPDYLYGRVVERHPLSDEEANENRFEVSLPFSQMGPVPNQEHLPGAIRKFSLHFTGAARSDLEGLSLVVIPKGARGAERLKDKIVTIIISDPE